MNLAWIGTGTMGAAMAAHLVRAGHDVAVWNRTLARTDELATLGARAATSPADAATGADVVFVCVSDSPDVEQVVLGPGGAAETMASGSVLVDHSTISPAVARSVADALAARLGAVTVRGEISGFTRAASGHCYFSLKDSDGQQALLRCAMFRRAIRTP